MASQNPVRALSSFVCQSCRKRMFSQARRAFTTTLARHAEDNRSDSAMAGLERLSNQRQKSQPRGYNNAGRPNANVTGISNISKILDMDSGSSLLSEEFNRNLDTALDKKPYRLHVYAHKHNTHITLVQPPRAASATTSSRVSSTSASAADQKKKVDTLLSLSTGNIGFRKAGRGSYDAAYQLAAYALKQMQEKGMMRDIRELEVILRGFGSGREAVTKALLGTEGRAIRTKITSVVDATRLKQGGTRSPKPRRLG